MTEKEATEIMKRAEKWGKDTRTFSDLTEDLEAQRNQIIQDITSIFQSMGIRVDTFYDPWASKAGPPLSRNPFAAIIFQVSPHTPKLPEETERQHRI